jgi:hypothetical protein
MTSQIFADSPVIKSGSLTAAGSGHSGTCVWELVQIGTYLVYTFAFNNWNDSGQTFNFPVPFTGTSIPGAMCTGDLLSTFLPVTTATTIQFVATGGVAETGEVVVIGT